MNKKKFTTPNNPKFFKFNIYWVYAVIFLFFIGLQFFNTDITKKTNFRDFNNNMLQQNKVERITIVNKEKVFIYIKKEFLSEESFNDVSKQPFGNTTNYGPHYFFEIGSVETFNEDLKDNLLLNRLVSKEKIFLKYKTKYSIGLAAIILIAISL